MRYAGIVLAMAAILSCSKTSETTSLGNDIIDDTYPNKMDMRKHFREYAMDTGALETSFSLPAPGDTGFGVHAALSNHIVVGGQGNERAYGFVQFRTDTSSAITKRTYSTIDTVLSVSIIFARDSVKPGGKISVLSSLQHPVSSDTGGSGFDTLTFDHDTAHANVRDTAVLAIAQLKDSIVKACTTTNQTTARSLPLNFGFILKNLDPSGLVFINGIPSLVVYYKNKGDTTTHTITTAADSSFYYAFETDNAASRGQPVLSYASKRTAVFKYDMKSLWQTASAGLADTMRAEVVSAAFSMKNPDNATDTLHTRVVLWHELVNDGTKLDSLFNGIYDSVVSSATSVVLTGTTPVQADVRMALRAYEQGIPAKRTVRPSALYLYVRLNEDALQNWKKSNSWTTSNAPLLSAVITVP